jgi:hypothetical protein
VQPRWSAWVLYDTSQEQQPTHGPELIPGKGLCAQVMSTHSCVHSPGLLRATEAPDSENVSPAARLLRVARAWDRDTVTGVSVSDPELVVSCNALHKCTASMSACNHRAPSGSLLVPHAMHWWRLVAAVFTPTQAWYI